MFCIALIKTSLKFHFWRAALLAGILVLACRRPLRPAEAGRAPGCFAPRRAPSGRLAVCRFVRASSTIYSSR
ncbi:MC042.1R [Molluscum contagiosum virus]|uniref:MC042.1R n=1 Tax=Molluscum contagiosum virus TaxID=10279 RepID=A0A858A490_9POXV|nr:MC042.1R [Molluscum contagiosum virus]QHW16603.1 MC042.1R [Molluscum contagiosum virus]QHW17322.1 MC042.1R [Molluscum contagiosum virus]QHW17495.1 MC042.1R [Molluscum contagiosum virus]QHW17669.1 MC042.1R [Molluscum contagiosum virus]